ncbi:hypothetical protein M408DRAFT_76678 [Serendipita vermifera MAFF 305830]|uniref:BD-FAE-like domain-containing protein n=1 Tax=Serendipita vermifera MAFF 305830 TaxID=933852 RepID=A0A0C3AXQ7_SERVB|nr:hypothetical protein M408DRAFT_76678 [Serendipita vermifera MAFF 305830]
MQNQQDIPYGTDPKQTWDLYPASPRVGKPAGLIVFVHGGAWRSGDKLEHQELAKALVAATGLSVAVPNYRLSPRVVQDVSIQENVRHPTHAQDIALALSEIRRSDYLPPGTNGDQLLLIGHSCGAHMISSLLLVPPPVDGLALEGHLAQEVYESVKGVVLAEGIYDLDLLVGTFPDYRDFIQGAFGTMSSYSPFSVNKYSARAASIQWLVVHSSGDTLVDMPQADAMFRHLQSEYAILDPHSSRIRKEFTLLVAEHDDVLSTPEFVTLVHSMI